MTLGKAEPRQISNCLLIDNSVYSNTYCDGKEYSMVRFENQYKNQQDYKVATFIHLQILFEVKSFVPLSMK